MLKEGLKITSSEIPPQIQQQIIRMQQLQQSLELLISQRTQLEIQLRETEMALKELEGVKPEDAVYKIVGPLLVKADPSKVKGELEDLKVSIDTRIKTLKRQEERSRQQLEEMREKIQAALQGGVSPAG
ncbi:MAG: prefoldin subunit beta [Candidatus Freyarchaeota archaeon]|nr:prefoldin subunit beta [Candidatus Jordarchaeia archaeon]